MNVGADKSEPLTAIHTNLGIGGAEQRVGLM